ncbi:MAG: DUF488 family protein [Chloroflexi bacterium]|nr:DUF488 family protein [Chloroflexota bacterium]
MIQVKRMYELPSEDDGERYLVERLWPRGVGREVAGLAGWLKELAPSHDLRQWFSHDPQRWEEFQQWYETELKTLNKQAALQELAEKAQRGKVTLVFAARDAQHNSAMALKAFIESRYLCGLG